MRAEGRGFLGNTSLRWSLALPPARGAQLSAASVRAREPMISSASRNYLRLLASLAMVMVAALAAPALAASPSATVSATITIGIRSLSVSPSSVTLCSPTGPLTSPNGFCESPFITITNGPMAGHIDVAGANAAPSDQSGNDWALCAPYAGSITCTGPPFAGGNTLPLPGADQYSESAGQIAPNGGAYGVTLTTFPVCDASWNPPTFSCAVSARQAANEYLAIQGPATSTDQSPTFTSSVTWTAIP